MPYINCRVMEGVLSEDHKADIAEQITETFAMVVGEPVRGLTWVVIDDMTSGQFTIGGHPITTERVNDLLPGAPTSAWAPQDRRKGEQRWQVARQQSSLVARSRSSPWSLAD